MTDRAVLQESIGFRSLPGVDGIEVLDAQNSSRNWKWLHTAFGLALMTTWDGDIRYRRREQALEPGMVLCTAPGEIHTAPRVRSAGEFHVIMIDAEMFQAYVAEHDPPHSCATWGKITHRISPTLADRIATVLRFEPSAFDPMQVQSSVVTLFEGLVQELIEQPFPLRSEKLGASAAHRIRECLHSEEGATLDLHGLAERVGMSRFQVLRTFQSRFGLPPYAYQLCSRVARARTLLQTGLAPADVSAQCGFADQSHFGRHFKRLVGVTPARYGRRCDSARHSKLRDGIAEIGAPSGQMAVLSRA